ncbi:alcohol dehydrogenase catalytic domain-containing protein [Microbacterium tumbae]
MRAVQYVGPERAQVVELADPAVGPGDVRIAVERVGVCGTDLHVHRGTIPVAYPVVPGHEIGGIVDEVGEHVTTLSPGQRVAVNPNVPCGVCAVCRRRPSMQCQSLRSFGVLENGGAAGFIVVPEGNVFAVGDMPMEMTPFVEPVACVMNGLDRLAPSAGEHALVFGAGPSAAVMIAGLRHRGVTEVTVAAPDGFKLEAMSGFGATTLLPLARDASPSGQPALAEAARGSRFGLVVDVTGAPAVAEAALDLVGDGGSVMLYGVAAPEATIRLRPYDLFRRDLTVLGSFAQTSSMAAAIEFLNAGAFDPAPLVTHHFDLADWSDALRALEEDRTVHKMVIDVRDSW